MLAKRLANFPEYVFSRLNKKIVEIEEKTGKKVINLGVGSPDFSPSALYLNKVKEIIFDPGIHLYPGYGATSELKNALINWYKKRYKADIANLEILPVAGAKDAISHLPMALIDEEDEVLTPDPGYPAFSGPVSFFGGRPIFYQLTEKNNFKIDIKKLQKLVSKKTRFIWVNFPANPTGQVATLDELKSIVKFCLKNKIWLIYDNAYSEITFDGYKAPSIFQIDQADKVAIEIGSFSKTFSFAGFRIGWVVGNKEIVSALGKVKSQMDSGLSLVWQKLAAYALENFDEVWYRKMINSYLERRNKISIYLKKIGLTFNYPKGGLYLWAKIPKKYKNSEEFSIEILKKYQVFLTPGTAFGKNGDRYVRVSICSNIKDIDKYFN